MLRRHVSDRLAAYVDGELAPRNARQAEIHMGRCAYCRTDYEQIRFGMSIVEHLPSIEAPEAIWASIEAALRDNRSHTTSTIREWRTAFVAAAIVAAIALVSWRLTHQRGMQWAVVPLDGSPAVGARHISGVGHVGAGEWIETDSGSRATVNVGGIGSVEVAPNTRLRVVTMRADEHRLALARGEIRARISAPPRLFFVDTAAGTAIDLGCEYRLNTDEEGFGLLSVTKGWVSFQSSGLESLVPAGASCPTRPHVGPAIPYFDDAPERLKQALATFGFDKGGNDALDVVLAESRVRDTLTLWHLLARVNAGDRARVYDRIAALTPIPAGVSREQALKLDVETLRRWREELAWTW
jgi:hypothetical protein